LTFTFSPSLYLGNHGEYNHDNQEQAQDALVLEKFYTCHVKQVMSTGEKEKDMK